MVAWWQYSCVPQSNRAMQLAAISSLHAYAACSKYFVAVVPPARHSVTNTISDGRSYSRRGWCRLEQMAYVLVHGEVHAYMHDASALHRLAEYSGWLESAIDVFGADFTCADDRLLLVDVLLGLYGFAILGRGSESAQDAEDGPWWGGGKEHGGDGRLFELIEQHKTIVFPSHYFEDLVPLLEAALDETRWEHREHSPSAASAKGKAAASADVHGHNLFGDEDLARLLHARQSFLAIQGRSLAASLNKKLTESGMVERLDISAASGSVHSQGIGMEPGTMLHARTAPFPDVEVESAHV